ncbi:glycosyltransferase family 2 protein [Maribellus sp. CM-23]|uniref:glycosyltransferase family 2 protein n=1 Tax=Maribellus sp. CM-23 TaxID=2781026 RepID=UPI001F1D9E1F|nr:glycosyltransferase family 2 protein [Maribellus sp. CM-23]MCE4564981.1 glycosyltransferase family 2 protein [Maribellus sp. CM-23]
MKALIPQAPDESAGIIVVIPCLRERAIRETLESLVKCTLPKCAVEVIVLINHSETAPEETKLFNLKTKEELDDWISRNEQKGISFFAVGPAELRKKWAGAGLARKKGMDEAILRFNSIKRKDGIIVSLDADTLVEANYLLEIESHFKTNKSHVGATIAFSHQTGKLEQEHRRGIELYEQYLAYYKRALDFAGYPHSMFTVGSAFAVTAQAYVKRGGMNRRRAGEDFYFLQNLVQIGKVGEIRTTTVHPSARLSDRVPFGTGPVLQKWMAGEEDLTQTYNFDAFIDLKAFFDRATNFYLVNKAGFEKIADELPEPVAAFLVQDDFFKDIAELNANCASAGVFEKRFFQKFNAFRILKYLNFVHAGFYPKAGLEEQCSKLDSQFGY